MRPALSLLPRLTCRAGLLFCGLVAGASAQPQWSTGLALHYDSNLGRGQHAIDRLGDTAVELDGQGSSTLLTTERSSLIGEAGISTQWWLDYTALSRLAAEGALRYRVRLGPASTASWLELGFSGSVLRFKDSDIRDGAQGRVGLTYGLPLGERLSARLGYAWQARVAEEDRIFDNTLHEGFAQLDCALGDRRLIYGGVTVRDGDLVTVARLPNNRALQSASAVSRDLDTAFGNLPRRAYRIHGRAVEGELGLNVLLDAGLALDVSASGLVAEARGGNDYDSIGLAVSLLWSFD